MRFLAVAVLSACVVQAASHPPIKFQTSDRCIACHNGLTSSSGEDVSIGYNWRASIMANSARDPYWQASVRRESIDHPESTSKVEDDCSICHMPIRRYLDKLQGRPGQIFAHIPFEDDKKHGAQAADGVTCTVCHQIGDENFGKRESFNGNFIIDHSVATHDHAEYGPFDIQPGQKLIMQSSSDGFVPTGQTAHIRSADLCATCHTLITDALGPGGKKVGELPEQMPYPEWLHSDYRDKQTCQECHMPLVEEPAPIAHVLGVDRQGLHRHTFVAANFLMTNMLNRHRDDLSVDALPTELTSEAGRIVDFLQTKAAKVTIDSMSLGDGRLQANITVENLGGHKLPTAYPARRAWLHVTVRDHSRNVVFESGAINPDGSIKGNDNDADPLRYEPHYSEITSEDQVEIYEAILKDYDGKVTTGLLSAVTYFKDNRILPHGFNKATAADDIAVRGRALDDDGFTGGTARTCYSVRVGNAAGPFTVTAELWYQPIGFRWAHNLDTYRQAAEPRRFTDYYASMSSSTAVILAKTEAIR